MKSAFSALSMLISLAIVGILAAMMLPVYKNLNSSQLGESSVNKESIEEQVDTLVNEIELRKKETLKYFSYSIISLLLFTKS